MTPIFTSYPALGPATPSAAARTNRRRRWVFTATLLLACAASLAWVYARPAEYETSARWQFVFSGRDQPQAAVQAQAQAQAPSGASAHDLNPLFLTELQVITSRPLLEKLHDALQARGVALPTPVGDAAGDPIDALQRSLRVLPVTGTTVVQVVAAGASAAPLAPAVNTLFDVYQRQLESTHRFDTDDALDKAREEAATLQERTDKRRRELDAFRARHNIVSLERDESQVLSQLKGQSAALNTANEKAVAAEAKLRSLRDSIAAGQTIVRTQDDPTLANLEQRLSQAREQLRVLERTYTDAYFELDANARELRARVAALDEQLKQARIAAQQNLLAAAEIETAGARRAAERIAQQMGSARQSVQGFTARMNEYKAMQQDLDRLEAQRGTATARATALETSSRRVAPTIRVLEAASPPQHPARPDYLRDSAFAVGGSLLLALLAVGLVELLTRPEDEPPGFVLERSWGPPLSATPRAQPLAFDTPAARMTLPGEAPAGASPALPQREMPALPLSRELDSREIAALLGTAPPQTRTLLMALLSGLTADEAAALNWRDVEPSVPMLRLPDRNVLLAAPLAAALAMPLAAAVAGRLDKRHQPDAPVFPGANGQRQSAAAIDACVVSSAHDAALARPAEVNAALLRHACIANLVRQGAHFSDLPRWVGPIAPDAFDGYSALAPAGPKRPAEQIDPVLPVLRQFGRS